MQDRRRGEREKKYVKKVSNEVVGSLLLLWATGVVIFLISIVADEYIGPIAKRNISGLIAAAVSSFLVWRIALNGATARFSAIEANEVASDAKQIAKDALDVEKKKLSIESAQLMDSEVHEKAFDYAFVYPEVNSYHIQLCKDESYCLLAKCQKLEKLRLRFPRQVDGALERARRVES